MKKIPLILLIILLSACAGKEPPFDPVAKFSEAEKYMRKESFESARKSYQEIQEKAPERSYDPYLMLRIADTYYGEEKYEEAVVEYQSFLNYHPVHRDAPYAQYQIAMCNYMQVSTIDRDPSHVRNALKEFDVLVKKYPNNPYVEQAQKYRAICRDKLAQYEFYVGRFYYKKGSYNAAIGRFEKIIKEYPDTAKEKDALYYEGLSYLETGERDLALKALEALLAKYPSSESVASPLISRLRSGKLR